MENIIAKIRAAHRDRVVAMDTRKRLDLAMGAYLRSRFGWRKDAPAADRDRIRELASGLIECGSKVLAGKDHPLAGSVEFADCAEIILASTHGRAPFDAIEDAATKKMERLAEQLPVWLAFGKDVKGFGARSLAVIVAEAGDLSNYNGPNNGQGVAKLWRRMGLAPITKGDSTRAGSTWRKGGLTKDDWTDAGYSMRRRSFMFIIGDVLVKNQGVYREVYLARKEYERQKAAERGLTVAPSAKIPKARKDEFISDGHIHRRAQRYMEKRFLRDLWRAWRRANCVVKPCTVLPAATSSAQAERSAIGAVKPVDHLPSAIVTDVESARGGHGSRDLQSRSAAPPSSAAKAERRTNEPLTPVSARSGASHDAQASGRETIAVLKSVHELSRATPSSNSAQAESGATATLSPRFAMPRASSAAKRGRQANRNVSPSENLPNANSSVAAKAVKRPTKDRLSSTLPLPGASSNAGKPARRPAKVEVTPIAALPAATHSKAEQSVRRRAMKPVKPRAGLPDAALTDAG